MQEQQKRKNGTTRRLLRKCGVTLGAFYAGFSFGYHQGSNQTSRYLRTTSYDVEEPPRTFSIVDREETSNSRLFTQKDVDELLEQRMTLFTKLHSRREIRAEQIQKADVVPRSKMRQLNQLQNASPSTPERLFPSGTKSFASAVSVVDRDKFAQLFDTGVPLELSTRSNSKVLLLHAKDALPEDHHVQLKGISYIDNVEDAVKNCNYLSLVLTQPNRNDQCVAIMGNYNSYHVHRFMRTQQKEGKRTIDPMVPLKSVPRGADTRFQFTTKTPSSKITRQYWNSTLREYFIHLDSYLEELEPILSRIALCKAVVVMVCNYGHRELLMNFVCNARAKGKHLDLSGILLFATDLETAALAEGLGLTTYYNERLFHRIPQQHANSFGDQTYAATIVSKVFCVQLVNMLGYHVLFQDVDMVWFRDPLEYFQSNGTSMDVDIYMQHDGSHTEFYAPYSGNTGFYFVRNTERTQYLLNSLLVSGDLIAATKTHQAPFLSILSEHASLHGLRVKILPDDDFPGGMQFQHKRRYMRKLLRRTESDVDQKALPYIFHMSWTDNKDRKIEFLQQLGEFYVKDYCLFAANTSESATATIAVPSDCCATEAIFKCHYSDRPSREPCRNSPKYANGKSFW